MVTAGPISDTNLEEDVEALLQMLGEQDVRLYHVRLTYFLINSLYASACELY